MKKQLLAWKKEFSELWDKTSLMSRILIGAGISLSTALFFSRTLSRPLAAEVKALSKKMPSEAADAQEVSDLEEQSRELGQSAETWKEKAESTRLSFLADAEELPDILNTVRKLVTNNELALGSEELIHGDGGDGKIQGKAAAGSSRKTTPDENALEPPAKNILPGIGRRKYRYKLYGGYGSLLGFLREMDGISKSIEINNFSIEKNADGITASDGTQRILAMSFDMTIFFQQKGDTP